MPSDLTGLRVGRLLVEGSDPVGENRWRVKCDCGNTKTIKRVYLVSKSRPTRSCGCLRDERTAAMGRANRSSHGVCTNGPNKDPTYTAWINLKDRCFNKNNTSSAHYGGRGISVCDRWAHSFDAFLSDMGPRPSPAHSVDRHPDNDGDYEPGNCRWATKKEQARNRSDNVKIAFRGKPTILADVCHMGAAIGLSKDVVQTRIRIYGWDPELAISTPKLKHRRI